MNVSSIAVSISLSLQFAICTCLREKICSQTAIRFIPPKFRGVHKCFMYASAPDPTSACELGSGTETMCYLTSCFQCLRYIPTNEDGTQKMHRSVTSDDVEEYPGENQAQDIHLTKDEDIEYRSGILYSSSGTTFVQVLTLPQGKQQQLADGEEPLSNPNTFSANGSYTLDRMRCYTLSRSAAAPKNRRNVNNLVETSLRATIDKRK